MYSVSLMCTALNGGKAHSLKYCWEPVGKAAETIWKSLKNAFMWSSCLGYSAIRGKWNFVVPPWWSEAVLWSHSSRVPHPFCGSDTQCPPMAYMDKWVKSIALFLAAALCLRIQFDVHLFWGSAILSGLRLLLPWASLLIKVSTFPWFIFQSDWFPDPVHCVLRQILAPAKTRQKEVRKGSEHLMLWL